MGNRKLQCNTLKRITMDNMQEYWNSLSLEELLGAMRVCQKRYKENKPCTECTYFIRGKCNGQRDFSPYNNKEQMELIEDLHLEQLEQM